MKIKIILVVFMLIIASSFLFTILSSKTTTNNNKVFFLHSFIEAVSDHQILPEKIAKDYFINDGKDKTAKSKLVLTEIDTLRILIGKAYPKDFVVTQYHDLPKAEQVLTSEPDSLDNIFIVKQHGKKILNILMNETKIVSLNP